MAAFESKDLTQRKNIALNLPDMPTGRRGLGEWWFDVRTVLQRTIDDLIENSTGSTTVIEGGESAPAEHDHTEYAKVDHTHAYASLGHTHDTYTKEEVDDLIDAIPGGGGGGATYRIFTQPATADANGLVVFTGFATDTDALTGEAKWAVKKQFEIGTEQWAGKVTFDQVLDNYLSLTYS